MSSLRRFPACLLACVSLLCVFPASVQALNIALENNTPDTCQAAQGGVFERVIELLQQRGHNAVVVTGDEIDTAIEINQWDVIVFGAGPFSCGWDWLMFDHLLEAYVRGGGGVVVTGWGAYFMADNPNAEVYPGLEATLPVRSGTGFNDGTTISVVPGHPITDNVSSFVNPTYNNFGGGTPPGATVLIRDGATDSGAAWSLGGHAVYLGPIYLASWSDYDNAPLLDGSIPDSQLLLIQAIEWAGEGSPSLIFADGFESGDLDFWTHVAVGRSE